MCKNIIRIFMPIEKGLAVIPNSDSDPDCVCNGLPETALSTWLQYNLVFLIETTFYTLAAIFSTFNEKIEKRLI